MYVLTLLKRSQRRPFSSDALMWRAGRLWFSLVCAFLPTTLVFFQLHAPIFAFLLITFTYLQLLQWKMDFFSNVCVWHAVKDATFSSLLFSISAAALFIDCGFFSSRLPRPKPKSIQSYFCLLTLLTRWPGLRLRLKTWLGNTRVCLSVYFFFFFFAREEDGWPNPAQPRPTEHTLS